MKRLDALDLGFLFLEKRHQPLHVAYLNLHSPPPGAGPEFGRKLVERMRSYATPLPPFNQRLDSRIGRFWVEDPEFDIEQHVIHLSLPPPGRIRDLLAMVSRMHSSHLDRAYPLWRTYVIEGVEGGRIATYSKVHHAVADGVAGTRLMLKSMSADPEEVVPPSWALPPRVRRERSGLLSGPVGGISRLAGLVNGAVGSVPGVVRELRKSMQEMRDQVPDFVSGFQAPPSILNGKISASRRFAAQTYSLPRVKAAGKALGCTVNDLVLAMCSTALRRLLVEMNALPDKPLIAAVPMSTRRDHSDSGNQVVFLLANLGTHLADPAERLQVIRGSIEHSKRRAMAMSPGENLGYGAAMMAPGLFNMVLNPRPNWLAFNLVISNVPGPRSQMYWHGCTLDGMYPVSAIVDGMALNITLTSRQNGLDFGVIACRKTLPHVQRVLDYLGDALVELELLAGTAGHGETSSKVQQIRAA